MPLSENTSLLKRPQAVSTLNLSLIPRDVVQGAESITTHRALIPQGPENFGEVLGCATGTVQSRGEQRWAQEPGCKSKCLNVITM